jgi:anti-sigma factor RsiW
VAERHVSGDRLSAFLDDELEDDDAMQATRHLADCERCWGELTALRATRDALRALPSLQAPVLTAGIQARSQQLSRVVRRVKLLVVASVVPMMLGAGVYLLGGDPGEVEPATELFLVEHLGRTGGGPVPTAVGGGER